MANQSEIYQPTAVNPMSGKPANATYVPDFVTEPQAMRVIRILLYVVIFFVGVVGNILVLLVVYKTRSLRSGKQEIFCYNPGMNEMINASATYISFELFFGKCNSLSILYSTYYNRQALNKTTVALNCLTKRQ
jgi:hypothetical protein